MSGIPRDSERSIADDLDFLSDMRQRLERNPPDIVYVKCMIHDWTEELEEKLKDLRKSPTRNTGYNSVQAV